ncbi:reticulon-3 isoform X2 [Sorex fumeus]|uniref:reticulon-3 isoform X2 n=1 Tax=Sorex fumeus TaxID=62283 RepID=UPI0024AE0098|nr:reticulon-3 isoform X2 [Sorex fumeus]
MADSSAATQSPSVSSSSSGAEPSAPGGGGSPGACPALGTKSCGSSCADSFVSSSSSQPVSLFSTSQAQKPPTELSKAAGICSYTLSPSEATGSSIFEKDSPESPFEVIIDKATFDKEFKDSYKESANDFGSWAMHTDRESSADILESNDKVFPLRSKEAGRYPTSALRPRQFSHTNAALEEVSRCVNDMHNFTNEILTWDLVPQVKQQSDKSDRTTKTTGSDRSGYDSEIPVINLKANTHQKIPVCSINGSTPTPASTGDGAEASVTQEKAVIKKSMADSANCTKEIIITGTPGVIQNQGDTLSESSDSSLEKYASLGSGVSTVKLVLPDDHMKGEMPWQNSILGDVAEADSSGESDDTVIEDITTDTALEDNKIQAEESVPVPCAAVKTDERGLKEIPSCNKVSKTTEMSDGSGESPCSQVPEMNLQSEGGKQLGGHVSKVIPENPVKSENPKLPSAASPSGFNKPESPVNLKSSAYLELLHDESVKDIDDSSPEDLIAAFTEDREKGIVGKSEGDTFEAGSEKTANSKTLLSTGISHEHESHDSESKDKKNQCIEQSQGKKESEPVGAFPVQGTPVASLDLEQEQLTIKALKELSERQGEKAASAQDKIEPNSAFAPESSWPQKSFDVLERTVVKTGSDLGVSKKPTIVKETTKVDTISSLSKTELVNEHILARLLTDFSVHDLIFWRDVKKTGFVFGTTLIMLLSLAAFSVISVVSYLILALLSVTISFRVYKSVIQAVQKSEEGHPFKAYLDVDITLSSEAFHNYMNAAMVHINKALKLIIRLFLVEDLVDSLKLAVFMWLMTYVGAVFNGITLLILAELLVFSVPIVYEKYKTQIDHYVGIIRDQTKSVVEKIQAKLPGIAKKKAE